MTPVDCPDRIRDLVRTQVRAQRPYLVGGTESPEVKLNQNESPYDLPVDVKEDLVRQFLDIPFNRYPEEQPWRLMRAIEAKEGLPEGSVLVGNGSNELTYTLGLAYVSEGARVVLPRPMFSLYTTMVGLFGGTAVQIPPTDALTFDVDGMISAASGHDAVLTILATPNNPTGQAVPLDRIRALADACSGMLLVDEAYIEFNPHGSAAGLLETHPNVLIMRTLSKAVGLAGLRVGYLLGHPTVIAELLKARLPFMVDRLAETAALMCLDYEALLAERIADIERGKNTLVRGLGSLGVDHRASDTNFVLFRTPIDPSRLMTLLADEGVLVRNMGGYPELAGYLRVSAGTDSENTQFLDALEAALSTEDHPVVD